MKIEISEILVQSWLRYVKHCDIAQLNWKAGIAQNVPEDLLTVFEECRTEYGVREKTTSCAQFLKQAEADVVGFDFKSRHLYIIDTAFHEGGLGYPNNRLSILKKCFRNTLAGLMFFPDVQNLSVIFCTPLTKKRDHKLFQEELPLVLMELKEAFQKATATRLVSLAISIIRDDGFQKQIVDDTLKAAAKIADSSALFIRAVRLLNISSRPVSVPLQEDSDDVQDEALAEISLVTFYPKETFFDEAKQRGGYYVAAFDKDKNLLPRGAQFYERKTDTKSSFQKTILSRDEFRKDQRARSGIEYLVAYAAEEHEDNLRNKKAFMLEAN